MKLKIELTQAQSETIQFHLFSWLNDTSELNRLGLSSHTQDLQLLVLSGLYKRLSRLSWEGKARFLSFHQVEVDALADTVGLWTNHSCPNLEKYRHRLVEKRLK